MNFKIQIPKEVYDKVLHWVRKSNDEVSGFGTVVYDEKGSFIIQDAFLLEQQNGGAHTDIDAASLSKLMYKVHKDGLPGQLKWWWHSHVNMETFWSTTDKDTIKELGKNGWIIASVFNKRESVRSAFCAVAEIEMLGKSEYFIDELKNEILIYTDPNLTKIWDEEYSLNVKEKKPWAAYNGPSSQGGTWDAELQNWVNKSGEVWDWAKSTWKKNNKKKAHVAKEWEEMKQEAALLNMSVSEYRNIIYSNDAVAIKKINDRLDAVYDSIYSSGSTYGNDTFLLEGGHGD